jgi:hypothetical protein
VCQHCGKRRRVDHRRDEEPIDIFPGGRVKDARLVKVNGLKSPFGIAIEAQIR